MFLVCFLLFAVGLGMDYVEAGDFWLYLLKFCSLLFVLVVIWCSDSVCVVVLLMRLLYYDCE